MNVFNSGCLSRYCRVPFWSSQCCKDRVASFPVAHPDDNPLKCTHHPTRADKPLVKTQCRSKHYILSNLNLWTQVRFKDNPQLHRDVPYPNFDHYRKDNTKDVRKTEWGQGDSKFGSVYIIGYFGLLCGVYMLKTNLIVLLSSMGAAADVLAMSVVEIDISKVPHGACMSFKWRGKPLFVKSRTPAEISAEAATPLSSLRDPETPEQRVKNPNWLVVIGICTHLGCVPMHNAGEFAGGFYCPCHGSQFDNIGRARKGPAPTNLVVPPYKFLSDTVLLVG